MNHWLHTDIPSIAQAYRTGELTPTELVTACLARIQQYDLQLHSFRHVMDRQAGAQALAYEEEFRAGVYRSPLHGIPITIKDNIAIADEPMTNGTGPTHTLTPKQHAPVVQRLLSAGAILIGKSHLHAYAYGAHHPYYEPVVNPWDSLCLPGGSSSGAAAGIAAAFAFGAIGTDTAGSVRVPASFCGVAGFKPSHGQLDMTGITPLSPTLDHIGIIARSAADIRVIYESLVPHSNRNSTLVGLERLRLGIALPYWSSPTEPETARILKQVVARLENAGATCVELPFSFTIADIKKAAWTILHYEAYTLWGQRDLEWQYGGGVQFVTNLERGRQISSREYRAALDFREQLQAVFTEIWSTIDLWIAPTCPWPAKPLNAPKSANDTVNGEYTPLANMLGAPALSVNAGFSSAGMPIGLEIVGPFGHDDQVLALGIQLEQLLGLRAAPLLTS